MFKTFMLFLAVAFLFSSCNKNNSSQSQPISENKISNEDDYYFEKVPKMEALKLHFPQIELIVGNKTVNVELANTPERQYTGLRYRDTLLKDSGMVFFLGEPKYVVFTMENTNIPLTIAFTDLSGKIVKFYDMVPHSGPEYNSNEPVSMALEMNQGWFKENGVKLGDYIKIK